MADLAQLLVSGLIGGVVASAVGGWFTLKSVSKSTQADAARDTVRDRRALRDRKAERLRATYSEVLLTVLTMRARAYNWRWEQHAPTGETPEQRGARIQLILDEAKMNIDRLEAALVLESEEKAAHVLDLFDRLDPVLFLYASAIIDNIQTPNSVPPQEVQAMRKKVEDIAAELTKTVQQHISALEQPI
jgi:hypothetical protein